MSPHAIWESHPVIAKTDRRQVAHGARTALADCHVDLMRELRRQGESFAWLAACFDAPLLLVMSICSRSIRRETPLGYRL